MEALRRNARAAAVAVGLWAMIIAAWWGLERRERQIAERQVELVATQASLRLRDYVRARLLVVESMARERAQQRLDTPEAFRARARSVRAELPGLLAVNWIDAGGVIRWVSPRARNRAAEGKSVLEHPVAAPYAADALETGKGVVTPPVDLFQGVRGLVSYFPVVSSGGEVLGLVNGVFDAQVMVHDSLQDEFLDDFALRVVDEGQLVFSSDSEDLVGPLAVRRIIRVGARTWVFEAAPEPHLVASLIPGSHDLWALSGFGVALVLALLVRAQEEARRARREDQAERRRLEQDLLHAQKMEALGRLASGIAHDFNNVLTAMMGHAELAASNEDLPTAAREDLAEVLSTAQRAAAMTRRLLAFSRKQPEEQARFDPGERVQGLAPMLRHLVPERVRLRARVPAGLGYVQMDPSQLDQIVINLVVNAVDAMPEGGRLAVGAKRSEVRAEAWFVLTVADTGEGMSEAVRARIFEPFYTTKAVGRGTGLGLAQVWDAVTRARGRLEVRSEEGVGSAFEVWLPVCTPGEVEVPDAPSPSSEPEGQRLLLVEDDHAVRAMASTVLRRAGFTVFEAESATVAHQVIAERGVAAVVSDVRLPEKSGPELCRELRAKQPDLPILFCSAAVPEHDERTIAELDAAFLAKPFTPEQLVAAVRALF